MIESTKELVLESGDSIEIKVTVSQSKALINVNECGKSRYAFMATESELEELGSIFYDMARDVRSNNPDKDKSK